MQIVTTDLSGRQVAFQHKQNPIPAVNRVPVRSSSVASVPSSGQATSDIIFVSDDSRETDDFDDDFDDLDDWAIISPNRLTSTIPFVNRPNAARLVSQSSIFNPSNSFVTAPLRQTRMKPRFVQSASTCTCPPQRESVFQFSRFPQQSVNRFSQFRRFPFSTFPGVQFVFDDWFINCIFLNFGWGFSNMVSYSLSNQIVHPFAFSYYPFGYYGL